MVQTDASIGRKRLSRASLRDIEKATADVRAKVRAAKPKTKAAIAKERRDKALVASLKKRLAEAGLQAKSIVLEGTEVRVVLARKAVE